MIGRKAAMSMHLMSVKDGSQLETWGVTQVRLSRETGPKITPNATSQGN